MRSFGKAVVSVLYVLMVLFGICAILVGIVWVWAASSSPEVSGLAPFGLLFVIVGVVLSVVGFLRLRERIRRDEDSKEVRPRTRYVSGGERPAVAQARLDEAAKAVADRTYPKAFSPMYDESYEADRRGDVDALKELLDLATRIESAPDVHPGIRDDARELADRLREVIQRYDEAAVAVPITKGESPS
jgi:uncharacterized membrane protein YcjF (UPF0283 family)